MAVNLYGKRREVTKPYAIYKDTSGTIETRVLKTYQTPDNEKKRVTKDGQNVARWHVAVKSPFTYGSWEYGDSYIESVINGASLVYGDECFTEDYARDHGEQGRAVAAYRKGLPD
jgi:hypothetical protein